jgi:hypothetical protein
VHYDTTSELGEANRILREEVHRLELERENIRLARKIKRAQRPAPTAFDIYSRARNIVIIAIVIFVTYNALFGGLV